MKLLALIIWVIFMTAWVLLGAMFTGWIIMLIAGALGKSVQFWWTGVSLGLLVNVLIGLVKGSNHV